MGKDPASRVDPTRGGLDSNVFSALFEAHVADIFRYVAHRAGSGVAEELTAETFTRAFAGRDRFDPALGSAVAWLYGIATNVLRTRRREEDNERRALTRLASRTSRTAPSCPDEGVATRDLLRSVIAKLRPHERDVLYLVGGLGLSYEEAATALGLPLGTVRSRYARARRHAARHLAVVALEPSGRYIGRSL